MKKNLLHIICSAFLLLNLGLTQIAADFFHEHSAHEGKHIIVKEGTDSLQEAHPLCKICKLNLFHELFFIPAYSIKFYSGIPKFYVEFNYYFKFSFLTTATGRAPPAFC